MPAIFLGGFYKLNWLIYLVVALDVALVVFAIVFANTRGRFRKSPSASDDGASDLRQTTTPQTAVKRTTSSNKSTLFPELFPEKRQKTNPPLSGFSGAGGRIRTADLFITSESLYRLSHTSTCLAIISKGL